MKVGLYFGSFNPVHVGHLIIANHTLQHTTLDKIWFVVSPQNPLKLQSNLLDEYARLHLVKIALEGENKLQASDIEFKLSKPSYTIDTLTYLKEKYPNYSFTIILGSDSYQNIKKWKNWEVLCANYDMLIYQRPEQEISSTLQSNHKIINAPMLDISATLIRELIQAKKSIRYLVTDVVKEEIEKCGYYRKKN
jgi:nicotinate-nucleotide adenylyltransferase